MKTKGHPAIGNLLRGMESAETDGDRVVVVKFAPNRSRSAPLTAANLPILSKAYYTKQTFEETSMEPPLGSGPYKVGKFEQGRFVEFERVKDWWGENLPIMRGQHNFDVLHYDYYRDRDTAFEGFTAKSYTFREEFTSRVWATRYDFPAVKDGRVKRESIPDERPVRHAGLDDQHPAREIPGRARARGIRLRVRLRMGEQEPDVRLLRADAVLLPELRHDGEGQALAARSWRCSSRSRPSCRRRCSATPGIRRSATAPARTAGNCGGRRNCSTRPAGPSRTASASTPRASRSTVEFLAFERVSEPHHALYIKNLAALGIEATMRVVDPVQYRARMQEFDFDISMNRISLPPSPGDALRAYFSSRAAAGKGSPNFSGIANPVVDALIDKAIAANDRQSLYTACRALDRVLRGEHYWVAGWYKPAHWIAYWDIFGKPERQAALRARHSGDLVVRRRQGGEARRANRRPTAAAAWRGGRSRRAASRSATESARHPRDTRLSPAPGADRDACPRWTGREPGIGIDLFRNGERLVALGRGLAQLVGHIDRLADRHQHRRVRRADLADRSAAGVDADGDLQPCCRAAARAGC